MTGASAHPRRRNRHAQTRGPPARTVAEDAVIEIFRSTGDPGTAAEVTVAELAAWLDGLASPELEAAFNVTVADGEVTALGFVYRP